MTEAWTKAIITDISIALFVPPEAGTSIHTNRPFHGLVINDLEASEKNYYFSDGTVLRTRAGEIFYLPKGTTYRVQSIGHSGGCWAINFSLLNEIADVPFGILPKDPSSFIAHFKEASVAFQLDGEDRDLIIRNNLYSILLKMRKELHRKYIPNSKQKMIQPALDLINRSFTDPELTVHALAELCGISDAYFRRIFADCLGTAPQEYIINRRINYARHLLNSGQFSVSEVAELCGYFDLCHFSRAFTKRVGVSPRTYLHTQGK